MAIDNAPDYASYSIDDLHDVAKRIDRKQYPDRYASVIAEIEKRKQGQGVNLVEQEKPIALDAGCAGGCCGGCLGPILLALIIHFSYLIFIPEALVDSHFIGITSFTALWGLVLGGLTGFALMLEEKRAKSAGSVALIGGSIAGVFVLLQSVSNSLAWLAGPGSRVPTGVALNYLLPLYGVPILWALLLIALGIIFKTIKRNA